MGSGSIALKAFIKVGEGASKTHTTVLATVKADWFDSR
jgi:hypothetical protein